MESKLSRLMDLQKFAPNAKLAKMIAETESRYFGRSELSEEEQELVTAAQGNENLKTGGKSIIIDIIDNLD